MSNDSISRPNPLLIPELFHYFLECLVTSHPQRPGPSKDEQQALAALARTCRSFSKPSLNCLWRRLNSLLPMVRCFANVVDKRRVKTHPSAAEWLIINRYAPRVQELTLGNEYLSLYFLQFTGLVLPNLRVLRLKYPPISRFFFHPLAFLWSLFGSQIVTLEVEVNSLHDPNYLLFLHSYFPLLCPDLKSVKLNFPDARGHAGRSVTTILHTLSRAICNNADWKHVEISGSVDYVVLKHLGMSSTLRTVSLQLASQTSRLDEPCFGPQDIPFRNVTDLALTLGNSLDSVTCLLRPHDQAFHRFKVILYTVTFPTEVSALLTALASPQRIHSLQSVTLDYIPQYVTRELPMHQYLTCETFRPLVSLVHLRNLAIHMDNPISMYDDEFEELVRNWPLLETFKMMWTQGEHPVASVTLEGLLALLASCPNLRQIGLTLDARNVPKGAYVHADLCRPLITAPMAIYDSTLLYPDRVAAFLTKHLPSMRGVRPTRIGNSHVRLRYIHQWSEVNVHMHQPPFVHSSPPVAHDVRFSVFKRFWPSCVGRTNAGSDDTEVNVFPPEEEDVDI